MPRRTDIHKIMVIGSGPIVIGQAAEFDYAGSQACQSLREEGYEVILIHRYCNYKQKSKWVYIEMILGDLFAVFKMFCFIYSSSHRIAY